MAVKKKVKRTKRAINADKKRRAKPIGWRIAGSDAWTYRKPTKKEIANKKAKSGNKTEKVYYEGRANRGDKGRML